MKKIHIIALLTCASVILVFQACTKNYEELNEDSALVTEELIDLNLLLTRLQYKCFIDNAYTGNGTYGELCGMNGRDDNLPYSLSDAPWIWNASYRDLINNASEIIRVIDGKEDKEDYINIAAITRIIKVWAVAYLTDTYGDVPYSESCLPPDQIILQPKYDTQESIYADLFSELKAAVAQLDNSKETPGSADLIYGGDVDQWKKLANSLRLRLALRVHYANATTAQAQLSDLAESELITTVANEAYISYADDIAGYFNPRYNVLFGGMAWDYDQVWAHKVMIDLMMNDSVNLDPRLKIYADTVLADFKGGTSPNGYTVPNWLYRGRPTSGNNDPEYLRPWTTNTCSRLSDFWRVKKTMAPILKSSEVYLNLAEAKLANLLPAGFTSSANDYYQAGIDRSIEWYEKVYEVGSSQMSDLMLNYIHKNGEWTESDVTDFLAYKKILDIEISAFKATPVYTLSGTEEEQLEMIINQKIIALYPQEFQGWCEYRRTGYPKIPMLPTHAEMDQIPRRESWPIVEQTINTEKYQEALTRYGEDSKSKRFWWDAKEGLPYTYEWTPPTMPTSY